MRQATSGVQRPYHLTSDGLLATVARRGGPGLRRVRKELDRPGSNCAQFDNRSMGLSETPHK